MNPTIQSGMHPDAESLTAFAEQLMPAPERDQILAHMATCSRCREVVFLSQRTLEEDQPEAVPSLLEVPKASRASWFGGWRWAWVPIAALAAFIGVAVLQHFRGPAESTQVAINTPKTDALQKTEPSNAPPASAAPSSNAAALKSLEAESTNSSARRDGIVRREDKEEAKQLDEKKAARQKDDAVQSGGASIALPPGVSGGSLGSVESAGSVGSLHGTISARAKGASIGGPVAANQFQQQNPAQQNITQQNSAMQAQNVPADAANKPVMPSAALGAASEAVTVQADKIEPLPTPAPAAPAQVSSFPLTGKNEGTLSPAIAKQKVMQKITLASGLGVLSVASGASRSIALDTAGTLFLSEDSGKQWQSIQTQWTGRPLLVRTRPVGTQNGASRAPQTMRFELVNDKLQTWFSYDGKTWTAQPSPLN
jgi:Putative zinc-finger